MLSTRARVGALTSGLAWSARSTVPVEIPSARAMSLIPITVARRHDVPCRQTLAAMVAVHARRADVTGISAVLEPTYKILDRLV